MLRAAQGLRFGRARTPSSRLLTGLFCRWETRPPSVNVTNQAYLIHYSLTAAASHFQLLLEGALMPEMSRWHHVTGGIDSAPLGFNVTAVQWDTRRAHTDSQQWDRSGQRLPASPVPGPGTWEWHRELCYRPRHLSICSECSSTVIAVFMIH